MMKMLKVLIAEDDETSDMLMTIALKKISNEFLHVKTGVDAVETCVKNPDIDLILMDIKMPEMDGYEATRQIRKVNPDVVIIAQTAYSDEVERGIALRAGCNDYLAKPLSPDMLLKVIQKHLGENPT
jgi:CheY-like chemotaxis protein